MIRVQGCCKDVIVLQDKKKYVLHLQAKIVQGGKDIRIVLRGKAMNKSSRMWAQFYDSIHNNNIHS